MLLSVTATFSRWTWRQWKPVRNICTESISRHEYTERKFMARTPHSGCNTSYGRYKSIEM